MVNKLKKNLRLKDKANISGRVLQKDREDALKLIKDYDKETDKLVDKLNTTTDFIEKIKIKKEITKRKEKYLDMVNRLEETGRGLSNHIEDQYKELEYDVYKGKRAAKDLHKVSEKRLKELTTLNPFKRVKENDWKKAAEYVGAISDKEKNKAVNRGAKSQKVLEKTTKKILG